MFRDAEEHADHAQRHDRAEVLDEVEPIAADQGIEAARGEFADLWLQGVDRARDEGSGEQISVDVVDRGIFEDQGPWRNLHAGLQNFQYHALGGTERLVIDQCAVDVVESAQRVEVVGLVVVQRCVVP